MRPERVSDVRIAQARGRAARAVARTSHRRAPRAVALALLAVALCAAPAGAQAPLAPSLSLDTLFTPPTGVAVDGVPNMADIPGGVAVDGDRIYTAGESAGNVAIVARRPNGTFDTAFAGDGRLDLVLGAGKDIALAIVVLPDHRLRVLVSTDTLNPPSTADNIDAGIVGLNADGTDDLTFGGGDGRVTFPVGLSDDSPSKMAVGATGRLAIAGWFKDAAGKEDSFVALREPDGSPVTAFGQTGPTDLDGLTTLNRAGGGMNDRAIDIAFRPGGGVLALMQVTTNPVTTVNDWVPALHAFTDAGADDPAFAGDGDLVLAVGAPSTTPSSGALLLYGGRWWVTGGTKVVMDTDAFLARLSLSGDGLESRLFDMRGGRIPPAEPILSSGVDLAVLPGSPDTLVVGGSITFQSRPYWAAAAFNNLGAEIAALGFDDMLVLLGENEHGSIGSLAPGDGWMAAVGSIVNFSNFDTSFGTTRLFVDADKRCDLAVEVPAPLEVTFEGKRPAGLRVKVTNTGTKACAGTVSVPPPYALAPARPGGALPTGLLAPGASYDTGAAVLTYAGPRRREDTLRVRVSASADANAENDSRLVGVVFSYCDVRLRRAGSSALLPSEGSRVFEFSLRNLGTAPCRRTRLTTRAGARSRRVSAPFTLEGGRSASEEVTVAAAGPRRVGSRVRMSFGVAADADVEAANDSVGLSPLVVGVGDTTARRPDRRGRRLSGTARPGRGPITRRKLRVTRVHVAVRRVGGPCRWLASRSGRLRAGAGRLCDRPVWIEADGTARWALALKAGLPPGRYQLYSRATIAAGGFREASFGPRDRNRVAFSVR